MNNPGQYLKSIREKLGLGVKKAYTVVLYPMAILFLNLVLMKNKIHLPFST